MKIANTINLIKIGLNFINLMSLRCYSFYVHQEITNVNLTKDN